MYIIYTLHINIHVGGGVAPTPRDILTLSKQSVLFQLFSTQSVLARPTSIGETSPIKGEEQLCQYSSTLCFMHTKGQRLSLE